MNEIENTYNIHKKIKCIIPIFKSKFLCKLGIHNFQLFTEKKIKQVVYRDFLGNTTPLKYIYMMIIQ